jgi:hypothetical protein
VEPVFRGTVAESLLTNMCLNHLRLFLLIIFISKIPNFIINIWNIHFISSILISIFFPPQKIEGRGADQMSGFLPLLAHILHIAWSRNYSVVLQADSLIAYGNLAFYG